MSLHVLYHININYHSKRLHIYKSCIPSLVRRDSPNTPKQKLNIQLIEKKTLKKHAKQIITAN